MVANNIQKKKQSFRINSLRTLLGLSIYEAARLLDKSHYTVTNLERSTRLVTEAMALELVQIANNNKLCVNKSWLLGLNDEFPKSEDPILSSQIETEEKIEKFILLCEDPIQRKIFSQRIIKIISQLNMTKYKFAKWCETSLATVESWAIGKTIPLKDTIRLMVKKIKKTEIPISEEWLLLGEGELPYFQFIVSPEELKISDPNVIKVTIKTDCFEPTILKNTKVFAISYDACDFVNGWEGNFLFRDNNNWIPVKLQATKKVDFFNVISLHSSMMSKIIYKDRLCKEIHPIVYYENSYPIKIKNKKTA